MGKQNEKEKKNSINKIGAIVTDKIAILFYS